ncbi:MAG: 30S ribosomal protein S8 [Candidatus Cloacimonas sp.]|jgi:small subunit ribosomal protein S8|nr:30S ribosomal protein S8 [Candidatus Cloacimonadota bacterium]
MSLSDPIADALTKIRNAYRAGHKLVTVNHSNVTEAIIKVLSDENFLNNYEIVEFTTKKGVTRKGISINLRYTNNGKSVITGLERISKPGRRVYVKAANLPRVFNNIGCAVLSTNRGMMVDRTAREMNIGGEYICKVW